MTSWICPACHSRLHRRESLSTTWEAGPNECLFCGAKRLQLVHEHEWVDTTVLEDGARVEICAAGGCNETRTVPR